MRLFVSDLDGTLLNEKFAISDENIKALNFANSKGVQLVIASGRIYKDVLSICERYSLKPHIISNNGACVYSMNGELIYCNSILRDHVEKILNFLNELGVCWQIATSDYLYILDTWEKLLEDEYYCLKKQGITISEYTLNHAKNEMLSQVGIKKINSYKEYFKDNKVCFSVSIVSFSDKKREKITKYINEISGLTTMPSGKYTQEIMRNGSSKGDTLMHLAALLDIPMDEIIAIGDNLNDKTMIRNAGIGIAVENADDNLKEVSDFITKSNKENGVAYAIYKFIDKEN